MNIDKKYIQNIIYNSGDVFLPEKVKNILGTDLIGNSKKTLFVIYYLSKKTFLEKR